MILSTPDGEVAMSRAPDWVDAATVTRVLPMAEAVTTLTRALRAADPGAQSPRTAVDVRSGQLLLMPAEVGEDVGVKVVSVAPDNPARGVPRVQAIYVLFDARTLSPRAVLDGTALTSLRTPALSAVAAEHLAVADAARLVVFGCGPQARGHIEALRCVRPIEDLVVVGRRPERVRQFLAELDAAGLTSGLTVRAGSPTAVSEADVIVCATTAAEPLFPGALVPDAACVIAVGSHEPDRRELDDDLMARSTVVVEHKTAALREAGDLLVAVATGNLKPSGVINLADLVRETVEISLDRPRVFKSVGMAWEDLVVAAEVCRRLDADPTGR
jgi:ornithine cyclodeaminase/alanine dehydrogenase-like protein (mu-crystallin family)